MKKKREIITVEDLLCKIVGVLDKLKISYLISGGFAVAFWGRPRFTADIDIVIEIVEEKISFLARELRLVDKDVYVREIDIKDALLTKREFNFIHPGTGIKVDFFILKDEPFDKIKMRRVKKRKIKSKKVNLISPEDLILSKLEWYKKGNSERQIEDIRSVLKFTKINRKYLEKWAKKLSLVEKLRKLL